MWMLLFKILMIALGAYLWRLGGSVNTYYRKWGIGIIAAITLLGTQANAYYILIIPIIFALLQWVSYGLTSPIHKAFVSYYGKGANGDDELVEFATRLSCALIWLFPILIIKRNVISYIICTLAIGATGSKVKNATVSECVTGGLYMLCVVL